MKLLILLLLLTPTAFAAQKANDNELVLNSDNTILLDDIIEDTSVAQVMQKAQTLDSKLASGDPIYLVLSSPGGSIQDGLEMITMLKGLNRPVNTVTFFAASMAFQTVQGLGTRYITHFGTLMAHKAKGMFSGEFPGQIDSRYVFYIKRLNELDKIAVARTGGKLTDKSFKDLYAQEVWIDGFDSEQYGLADKVVTVKCDHSLNGTRSKFFNFMGFSVELVFSQCPNILGTLDIKALMQTDKGLMPLTDFLQKGGSFTKVSTSDYVSSYSYNSGIFDNSRVDRMGPPAPKAPQLTVEGITMNKINEAINRIKASIEKNKIPVMDYFFKRDTSDVPAPTEHPVQTK